MRTTSGRSMRDPDGLRRRVSVRYRGPVRLAKDLDKF
jgi:hypothetical protein